MAVVLFIDDQPETRLEPATRFYKGLLGQDTLILHSFTVPDELPPSVTHISFDNDLAQYGETFHILWRRYWDAVLHLLLKPGTYVLVHSMNSVANRDIQKLATEMGLQSALIPFGDMLKLLENNCLEFRTGK